MKEPSEKEEQLFAEALALPPRGRGLFLDQACADQPALRRRIESLLLAHEAAGMFMTPQRGPGGEARANAAQAQGPADQAGTRIGKFKLLQKVGEGGCGVVWMAEQEEPVRRRVALKVIKLGMDTKNVIARFEAERQALALMDHPNIARVFEAGATDTGRPYFVMELVPGVPITKYCDEHQLSTIRRLELFTQVCHAVQHAHQKGVIHRDLKPSNILVTLHDGEPVPKVIDFGIAKATQGRLTDATLFTAFEQFIGTPAYMSPEQAELSGIDVDTRSDIYSLGVLLYELLTGRPPFDPKSLFQAGLDEVRRIIREVEPVKPSTRLNTLADGDRLTVARQRGLAPTQLSVLLRGDLDWIVMKALEKKRSRRYETANGLALDIQRHLQHEPVVARPPTTGYRVSRFVRRNRMAVVAVSAVALTLIAGTVVSTWQALRARRAEQVAESERARAVTERARAEDLLGFMIGDLRQQLTKVGRLDVLEAVGGKAMAYFSSRTAAELDDATLTRHAQALRQIGELRLGQARSAEALAAFDEAYARAAALVTRHPTDGTMLFERGQAEYWSGFVRWKRGELDAATEWMNRYHTTSVALVALDPAKSAWQNELAYSQHNLAVLKRDRGEMDAARADFVAELATLEKLLAASPADGELRQRVGDAHSWLGGMAEQQGRFADALDHYVSQTAQLEALVRAEPDTVHWKYDWANALLYQTDLNLITGKLATAAEKLADARRLLAELVALDPANRRWEIAALNARLKAAALARAQRNSPAAATLIEDTLPALQRLVTAEPADRGYATWLAKAWRLTAQVRADLGRDDAATAAKQAVEAGEALLRTGRVTAPLAGEVALARIVSGEIARRAAGSASAQLDWQRAWELVSPNLPATRDWRLLDPAVRASVWLGRDSDARTFTAVLEELGYVPLDPWPTAPSHSP